MRSFRITLVNPAPHHQRLQLSSYAWISGSLHAHKRPLAVVPSPPRADTQTLSFRLLLSKNAKTLGGVVVARVLILSCVAALFFTPLSNHVGPSCLCGLLFCVFGVCVCVIFSLDPTDLPPEELPPPDRPTFRSFFPRPIFALFLRDGIFFVELWSRAADFLLLPSKPLPPPLSQPLLPPTESRALLTNPIRTWHKMFPQRCGDVFLPFLHTVRVFSQVDNLVPRLGRVECIAMCCWVMTCACHRDTCSRT